MELKAADSNKRNNSETVQDTDTVTDK